MEVVCRCGTTLEVESEGSAYECQACGWTTTNPSDDFSPEELFLDMNEVALTNADAYLASVDKETHRKNVMSACHPILEALYSFDRSGSTPTDASDLLDLPKIAAFHPMVVGACLRNFERVGPSTTPLETRRPFIKTWKDGQKTMIALTDSGRRFVSTVLLGQRSGALSGRSASSRRRTSNPLRVLRVTTPDRKRESVDRKTRDDDKKRRKAERQAKKRNRK